MLCFPGSGGCPSEPQSLLCTGEVLPASPAFVPHGSSSSAHRSNLVRGGPARFSLSGERCRGVAASGQSEGNPRSSCVALCGPPLALVVHLRRSFYACWGHHHHRHRLDPAFFLQTRLRRHRWCWGRHHRLFLLLHHCDRQLQASNVACPRQSLLHHPRSSWLLWPCLPAQYRRCPMYLRPCRFWALGLSVHASSGSW